MIKKILTILSYKEKESISAKVGKGVVWSFLTTIIMRGLDLFSAIIVTRLLLPEDFGLLAASMAVIVFSTKTTQTGFASALIQKQQNPESYFNTAWTFEVIKGFLLFQLLFWGAPLISIILQDERLTPILKSLSFC